MATQSFQFEKALKELETLVNKMEDSKQPLEESLSTFKRGISLVHDCRDALKNAEQTVEVLLKKHKTS